MKKRDRAERPEDMSERRANTGVVEGPGRLGRADGPRPDGDLAVELFQDGRSAPFERWLDTLPLRAQTWIELKIRRIAHSHRLLLSGTKALGGGLRELRHLGVGPGYRVYLSVMQKRVIILGGGDKSGQTKDVKDARQRLRRLRDREGRHVQADHRSNGQRA